MSKVDVDSDYLSALRSLHVILSCSDDEDIANLEGNVPAVLKELERYEEGVPVHPVDKVTTIADIHKSVGIVSNEDYDVLSAAWSILMTRIWKYRKAMDAVDAWAGSHDQGVVWGELNSHYAALVLAANTIMRTKSGRPTSDYCRQHPDDDHCPQT